MEKMETTLEKYIRQKEINKRLQLEIKLLKEENNHLKDLNATFQLMYDPPSKIKK